MTKADSPKPPIKLETITLKVFIHCEGCRRKVRRIIRVVDGVEDVTVDSASGKVTVTGTADVKSILQRLQKYGKHAEMWPSTNPVPPAAVKAGANQLKPNNNNGLDVSNKKKNNAGTEDGEKTAAPGPEYGLKMITGKGATAGAAAKGGHVAMNASKPIKGKEASPEEASNTKPPPAPNGGGGGGGGGKKGGKKAGNGNDANNGNSDGDVLVAPSPMPAVRDIPIVPDSNTGVMVSANKSLAPYDPIQTGYAYHSAEYATHMFSDENANNCTIM